MDNLISKKYNKIKLNKISAQLTNQKYEFLVKRSVKTNLVLGSSESSINS